MSNPLQVPNSASASEQIPGSVPTPVSKKLSSVMADSLRASKTLPWQKILKLGLQFCPLCDHYWVASSLLCSTCERRLFSTPMKIRDTEFGKHVYLFDWTPNSAANFKRWLEILKYSRNPRAWQSVAPLYLRQLRLRPKCETTPDWVAMRDAGHLLDPTRTALLPAPSRTKRPDHAQHFATSLASELRREHLEVQSCVQILQNLSRKPQKEKNYKERQTLKIGVDQTQWDELKLKYNRFVFVDDVMSTGHTAMAAYHALGKPTYYTSWTLFYRRLSCDSALDLL